MRLTKRSAFTLVELLVVVAIVGVLAGLLLASLAQARALSRRTRCMAVLRQFAAANQLYASEFHGWQTPAFWGWSPGGNNGWPANPPPPVPASGPRQHWDQVWNFARALNAARPGNGRYAGELLCPDAAVAWERGNANGYALNYSYAMNRTQLPGVTLAGAPDYWNAWRSNQVRQPAEKIQFVDAVGASVTANGSFNSTLRYFRSGWGETHGPPNKTSIVAYRHSRGTNVLYFDGHVQWQRDSALRIDPADTSTTRNKRQWEPTRP